MSNGRSHHLNASRRRLRKEQLAARFGARCSYCRTPFVTLREATLDHIAPRSLWPSWSVHALTLACQPCNGAKDNRLPLSLALLLLAAVHPAFTTASTVFTGAPGPTVDAVTPTRPGHVTAGGSGVERPGFHPTSTPFTAVDWLLLARVAHARQSADRSTPDLRDGPRHTRVCDVRRARSIGRSDCLPAPARTRSCEPPTRSAVTA
ncbi:HNH endonuclease [Streptomyces sp. NPDC051561]|uniref:HNH endonuclease n=1 Tax=Streptomyces sp. NPDC051561 TaxID=3365658 RepID=UPI00378DE4B4